MLREIKAFLRVHGLSDEEAAALPVRIDAQMLAGSPLSTWRTAGAEIIASKKWDDGPPGSADLLHGLSAVAGATGTAMTADPLSAASGR